MESSAEEYAAFEEKVKRTAYIGNLSPQVTDAVLKTALGQFGNVESVQFIPNYVEPKNIPQCALVVMQMEKQVKAIIFEMNNFPFMMSGMPRPVRALAAEVKMFTDRPIKPGRRITCQWLDPSDRNFDLQLKEEEKLAAEQSETLRINYKKFEMLENLFADGSHGRLAYRYNLKVTDD
ncbi:hypothetical protein MKX01_012206 [Papaver californicum]|nr:hypothetical protein MKX01_012206 [Papaver californicum]